MGMDENNPYPVYMDARFGLHYKEGANHMSGIPEEMFAVIDPHWGKFPPQHPMIIHMIVLIILCLLCTNITGNCLVIYTFIRSEKLRTPTNMFMVNLAFSDLCMITSMGFPVVINQFFARYWAFGVQACRIYGMLGASFGTCSLVTLVAIGYDRYNVIVRGIAGGKITHFKAVIIIIFLWIYTFLSCALPLFIDWGSYEAEGLLITCGYVYLKQDWNNKSFVIFTFVSNYALPLVILFVMYWSIVKAVIANERQLKAQAAKMNVESLRSNNNERQELKIAKVALTSVMVWTFTWTPYAVITMIGCFGDPMLITPLASQLPVVFAKTGSCMNPLVFAFSHPRYREELARLVPSLGIGKEKDKGKDADDKTSVNTKI